MKLWLVELKENSKIYNLTVQKEKYWTIQREKNNKSLNNLGKYAAFVIILL